MEVKILDSGPEPVSMDDLRAICKMNPGEDDRVLEIMNKASRQMCQRFLNQSLSNQRIQVYSHESSVSLPYWPVKEVESVEAGDDTAESYEVSGYEQVTVTASGGPIKVIYKAGYTLCPTSGESACPEDLKLAIMLTVKYWYDMGYIDGKLPEEAKNIMRLATDNLMI